MIIGKELPEKRIKFDSLDGLRGLAVLSVFFSHQSNMGVYILPFIDLSGIGKSGVFLFFVLSSFLLTLPFVRNGRGALAKDFLLNYAFRRFFRIYPLFFVYLSIALFSSLLLWKIFGLNTPVGVPLTLSIRDFFEHLFLIQGKGITWSILVEFRYYFFLPIVGLTFSILFNNKLLPSIILIVGLMILSCLTWPPSLARVNDHRLGPYLPVFLWVHSLRLFTMFGKKMDGTIKKTCLLLNYLAHFLYWF